MENSLEKTNRLLDASLDCFSGADGGIGYLKLRTFIQEMIEKSNEGDKSAKEIVLLVERFDKLVGIATKD